jgi:phosphoesterase RecJ-like protein
MDQISEIKELLATPKRIVIVTHARCDGDAIGSALGLFHFLQKKNHEPTVLVPTDYPKFLKWLPGTRNVKRYDQIREKSKAIIDNAEIIFCLDFNALDRIEGLEDYVKESTAIKIMIDHHISPDDFATYQLWDTKASSTCELLYRFMADLGDADLINRYIATCLYTGIITDTGMFRHSCTTTKTHAAVAELMKSNVDIEYVHDKIFNQFAESRLRLLGHCLKEKMEIVPGFHTAIITITKEEALEFKMKSGDSEGLVNHPLTMQNIIFAALLTETTDFVKMSLRSKGTFDVQKFAKEVFGGGGHRNASGARSDDSLENTVAKLKLSLIKYKESLHQNFK